MIQSLGKLTILNIAYSLAPVRGDTAGGAEQVLAMLDRALVEAGATSLVVACAGSSCAGTLIRTPAAPGVLDERARRRAWENHGRAIHEAGKHGPIDLVHMHGLDFDRYLPPPGIPVLVTLHLPPPWYSPEAFRLERPRTYLHCVSESQRRACPPGAALLSTIENGVAVQRFPYRERKSGYVAALGRICPEKGFHIAIGAAERAGRPLFMAGEVYPYEDHELYFREAVLPRIDGLNCRFLGRLGLKAKCNLLAGARCVLIPSLAPETSSLVAMEALACGTPVVAFGSGALADIVEDGVSGFLVDSVEEMAEAIEKAEQIDPKRCRKAALERFSADRMIRQYFEVYLKLTQG